MPFETFLSGSVLTDRPAHSNMDITEERRALDHWIACGKSSPIWIDGVGGVSVSAQAGTRGTPPGFGRCCHHTRELFCPTRLRARSARTGSCWRGTIHSQAAQRAEKRPAPARRLRRMEAPRTLGCRSDWSSRQHVPSSGRVGYRPTHMGGYWDAHN